MKQLQNKTWAKVAATALLLFFCLLVAASGIGILFLESYDGYADASDTQAQEKLLASMVDQNASYVESYYSAIVYGDETDYYTNFFAKQHTNFFFRLYDENSKQVLENYWSDDTIKRFALSLDFSTESQETKTYFRELFPCDDYADEATTYDYYVNDTLLYYYWSDGTLFEPSTNRTGYWDYDGEITTVTLCTVTEQTLQLTGGITADLHANDEIARQLHWLHTLLPLRYWLIVFVLLGALGLLFCLSFLFYATGHKAGLDGIYLAPWHKIPLDLVGLAAVLAAFALSELLLYVVGTISHSMLLLTASACALVTFFLALYLLLTIVVRWKAGKWWHNTVCFRVLHFAWRGIKKLAELLPLIWKTVLVCVTLFLIELFFLLLDEDISVVFWFFERCALCGFIILFVLQLYKLRRHGQALASGDLHTRMPTVGMLPELRRHAEDLNRIGDGMNAAVAARLRSERLKTELITNVSHDLKTPLTSIVNYIDLMQQLDGLAPEAARDYLDVLQRQSARLKKLTEDLIEASKASSGVMPVHLAPTNLLELLHQVSREYEQKLADGNLTLHMQLPPQCSVQADGRLLWRVLDNLLNNCCKYAMPGTRVYLTVTAGQSKAAILLKNVSREMLTIEPERPTERFIRADASRSTEGSGMGLSIAQSLIELQHGTFCLDIDGDLFKVTLTLPVADTTPEA